MTSENFVCKVELSQTKGLILTVVNSNGEITQTTTFDGTTITHTCKGSKETSTITQTSSDIIIKCTNFKIEADTINCVSSKNTTHTTNGTFNIDSAKTTTINSSANLDMSATSALNITGTDLTAEGKNTAKLTAVTTTVNGDKKNYVMNLLHFLNFY